MKLDIVLPFYNEEECVDSIVGQLVASFSSINDVEFKLVLVDDGSTDGTGVILDNLAAKDYRMEALHLWGNHGHQKALTAGLDRCDADAVLMMDGDGQHPVETAVEMVQAFRKNKNLDVVQAIRKGNQRGILKNTTSKLFYSIVNMLLCDVKIKAGASDFRILSKRVLDLIKRYPDRYRNIRVLIASLKLPTHYVDYNVAMRIAGNSGYRFKDMLVLATDGWFAFSMSPLRISLLLMFISFSLVVLYLVYVIAMFLLNRTVPGWTSIIALIVFMFSAVFAVLSILSEYIARIYADVRHHPIYRLRQDPDS